MDQTNLQGRYEWSHAGVFVGIFFVNLLKIFLFFLLPIVVIAAPEASLQAPSTTSNSIASAPSSLPVAQDLAAQAVVENLPQVSAAILRTQMQQESDPVKRQTIALRLGEILITEGHAEEGLAVLDQNTSHDPLRLFWKAQALLALGRATEATSLLEEMLSSSSLTSGNADAAQLLLARAERTLGKFEQALTRLDQITPTSAIASLALQERCAILLSLKKFSEIEQLLSNSKELKDSPRLLYFLALASWQRGDRLGALAQFEKITSGDPWLLGAAMEGHIACEIALNKLGEAQVLLEKYLQENPQSPQLLELMTQLEQVYLLEKNNDINLFRKWSRDKIQPLRASYALLPYARTLRRLGHPEKANELLTLFLKNNSNTALADEMRLELAASKLQGAAKNRTVAHEVLKDLVDKPTLSVSLRARYSFVRGLAEVTLRNFPLAQSDFKQAALLDPQLVPEASFNEALIESTQKGSDYHGALALQPLAEAKLIESSHEKIIENVLKNPPLLQHDLLENSEVTSTPLPNENQEKKEYINVLNADQGDRNSATAVASAAQLFLKMHPHSSFVNQVRMKLGEALLRNGNARDARVELEHVSQSEASSELGRQALFLAAQAAARSMDPKSIDDALMLLEQVAQNSQSGNDQWQARLEQASLKNAQLLPLEAIALYDQILASAEVSPELHRTAQMAKGDTLSNIGSKDPLNYQNAITIWRSLADTPNLPLYWRNQALCKIGLINEKIEASDAALAAYYEAIKMPTSQESEFLWHDKAAFQAAHLLELRQQWTEAIALYKNIVAQNGPRALEAKARISKLRLDNFLWEK